MNEYLLNEKHELSGHWWIPEAGEKIHGVLHFNKNSLDLKLSGSFQRKKNNPTKFEENKHYSNILGECEGQRLTLFNCTSWGISVKIASTNSIIEKIKGQYLIVGDHIQNEALSSMIFYTPDLQTFMCHLVLKKEIQTSPEVKIKYEVSKNDKISFVLPDISSNLEIGYYWQESGNDYKKRIIETGAGFTIKPENPKTINWFLEQRKKITMWLTFLSGYGMSPVRIECLSEDSKSKLLVALPDQVYCSVDDPNDFFINKNQIEECFGTLLENWFNIFEKHPNFKIPCALAFETLAEKVTRAHFVDFLNLMQALEGIHRAFYDGVYMDQKNYNDNIYPKIFSAVPNDVSQNHRSSLKSRLKFGNEISLNKRLNDLAKEFNNEIKEILFGVQKKVPRPWVDTRNYFTHRDEETKESVLEGVELYEAIVKLRGFLRLTILRLMGVPQKLMINALSHSSHVSRELKQFS